MTFPLWYILVPYAAILLFGLLFLFFNLFHLLRYGIESGKTLALMGVYVVSFLLVAGASLFFLSSFNWRQEVDPLQLLPFNPENTKTFGV